jgi:hexokinase
MIKKTQIEQFNLSELQQIRQNLSLEISTAAKGFKNSIAFIKNPIGKALSDDEKTKAQIIVIGGSNLISAEVIKTSPKVINILSIEKQNLPNLRTKEILLELISSVLKPDINLIVLNFSYSLKPFIHKGRIDGELIVGTKEYAFNGLIGYKVGQTLESYMLKKYNRRIKVAVANDVVNLVLSGSEIKDKLKVIGGIVGTGLNFGFYEDEKTIINLESGNFNRFPQTDSGKSVCQDSQKPDDYTFEKEIAGGYLFKHYNFYLDKFGLKSKKINSTSELFSKANTEKQGSDIARQLFERSASLIACHIAAMYDFKMKQSLNIIMEGSLFWQGWRYKDFVFDYLLKLGVPYGRITIEKIEKSYILGAARLVL